MNYSDPAFGWIQADEGRQTSRVLSNYNNAECGGEGSRVGWVLKAARVSQARRQWKRLWAVQKAGTECAKAQG